MRNKNVYELHYSPKLTKMLLEDSDVREVPSKRSSLRSSCLGSQSEEALQEKYDQLWEENILMMRKLDTLSTTNEKVAQKIRSLTSSFVSALASIEEMNP